MIMLTTTMAALRMTALMMTALGRGEAGAQDNVQQNQIVYRKHVEADVDAVERQDYGGGIEDNEMTTVSNQE